MCIRDSYGLVGKNGAGKTTLLRMITGQSMPTEGRIGLFGVTEERELCKARRRTGAMIETPSFYPYMSAEQNLEYYRIQRDVYKRQALHQSEEGVEKAAGEAL